MRRLLVLVALCLAAGAAFPAGAAAACPGEDVPVVDPVAAEATMLCLLNEYRVSSGRPALVLDVRLARAARAHAQDMVARRYFSHVTPDGLGPGDRARREGFPSGAGENIAWSTHATPRSVFEQWRNSPGHDANMRGESYNVTGIGFALGNPSGGPGSRGATGVQTFGRVGTPVTAQAPPATSPSIGTPAAPGAAPAAPATARRRCGSRVRRVREARRRLASARRRAARAQSRGRRARVRAARRVRVARRALARARATARATCR